MKAVRFFCRDEITLENSVSPVFHPPSVFSCAVLGSCCFVSFQQLHGQLVPSPGDDQAGWTVGLVVQNGWEADAKYFRLSALEEIQLGVWFLKLLETSHRTPA